MNGKVIFDTVEEVAEFLKAFTGSTATFEAEKLFDGKWVIRFNGGY